MRYLGSGCLKCRSEKSDHSLHQDCDIFRSSQAVEQRRKLERRAQSVNHGAGEKLDPPQHLIWRQVRQRTLESSKSSLRNRKNVLPENLLHKGAMLAVDA